MKNITIISVFILFLAAASQGQWTFSNLAVPTDYMGATVLGSKAYFAGGEDCTNLLSLVEIYDVTTGQWDLTESLSVARELPFATTCGSKVIFAGGVDFYISQQVFATVDIYDTFTGEWSVEELSVPRLQAAVVSHGNKVLFAGGTNYQTGVTYDIVDIYDVQAGEWLPVSHLSEPRTTWWAKVGDKAIFAGGYSAQQSSRRVDIYNFTTDTWSIDSLSVPRAFVGMTTIGNKVLIAGGMVSGNIASNVVDIYDAVSGTWDTAYLSLARAFADNQQAVTACGKAYFVGGGKIDLNEGYWTAAYNVIDIYDGETGTWSVDIMPIPKRVHHAVVAVDNKIIIAGGYLMDPPYGCDDTVAIYTCTPSSCLPEGITFTTQEEIDNYQVNYPGCTEIEGDVTISGMDISNLNGLNVLTSIGGTLYIGINNWGNQILTSLTGLENLISIVGNLDIGGIGLVGSPNPVLNSLTGLDNLTSIGGELIIYNNPVLTSLIGLDGITSIGSGIFIHDNGNLTSCAAQSICDYLISPNGVVDIFENGPGCNSQSEVATDCGGSVPCLPYGNYYFFSQTEIDNFNINFPGCNELEGNFTINGDPITNLAGLNQVVYIGGNVELISCDNLNSLIGLNNLSHVGGNLNISFNDLLVNFSGLDNLNSIGGSLEVHENNQLISLSGLESLDSIGEWLGIGTIYNIGVPNPPPGGNDLLINLSPLESLTYVGAGIDIGRNNSLSSLAGLENINANTVTDLMIGNNYSLSTCHVQSVCDYLSSPNGALVIDNNAPGCNSLEDVEDACNGVGVEVAVGGRRSAVSSYPNPFTGFTTFEYELEQAANVNLSIYNHLGQRVAVLADGVQTAGRQQVRWDAEEMPAGIYYYRLTMIPAFAGTGDRRLTTGTGKIVKY